MTLEQLRIFVTVAELEHVTQAAHGLHLTQSATSAAISALESRYAIQLFDRIGRRIALTDAGRLFLEKARAVLAAAADAEVLLADLVEMRTGRLVIAASQTIGSYWIPRVMAIFAARFPGIDVALELGNTEFVAGCVRDGKALLGFVEGPVEDTSLALEPLFHDELVLVGSIDHSWSDGDVAGQLGGARWIVRESGSGTRTALENALASYGLSVSDIDIALTLPSNEAVLTAVEAGAGITIVSRMAVICALGTGALKSADIELPRRGFFALRHRDRHYGRAAALFLDLARAGPFAARDG